jgi:hypothetical protein
VALSAATARSVNDRIRDLAGSAADPGEWLFFCECGNPGCFAVLWLAPVAFDDRIADGRRLLADGHRGRAARARARDLCDMAEAVNAQARQAVRRASALRRTIRLSAELAEQELLDAVEDVERLLERADEDDICPAMRTLLLALDDALQASRVEPPGTSPR